MMFRPSHFFFQDSIVYLGGDTDIQDRRSIPRDDATTNALRYMIRVFFLMRPQGFAMLHFVGLCSQPSVD